MYVERLHPSEERLLADARLLEGRLHLRGGELLAGARPPEGRRHLREGELLAGARLPEGRLHLREGELLEGARLPEEEPLQSAGRLRVDEESREELHLRGEDPHEGKQLGERL